MTKSISQIIRGQKLNQLNTNMIVSAIISFKELKSFIKFTQRIEDSEDPFSKEIEKEKEKEETENDNQEIRVHKSVTYYQRLSNSTRVKNVYNFLLKEIYNLKIRKENALGIFPTSILLSLDLVDNQDSSLYSKVIKNEVIVDKVVYSEDKESNIIKLFVPNKHKALIVDGQHRIAGMIKLYEDCIDIEAKIKYGSNSLETKFPGLTKDIIKETLENFDLNCTLLLGFDVWEQGKIFADVNFNQKPVNKSLYYDIFGSYPDPDKNEIYLAHMLTKHLNNSDESVIKNFIKMLGAGNGYFSQAFIVESFLRLFSKGNAWADIPLDYIKKGKKFMVLPKLLKIYFRVVKNIFIDYWPKKDVKYEHILCKTTGMGAIIRILNDIYINEFIKNDINIEESRDVQLEEIFKTKLNLIDKVNAEKFFSKDGDYSGSGSLGSQGKLYKEIKKLLEYK